MKFPDIFTSHEYASMILDLVTTYRFHVCCETPLVYKKKIKLCLLDTQHLVLRREEGEAHIRNQVSGILLFHIIVTFIRVNLCYNKVL